FILTGLGAGMFAPRLWFRGGRFAWSVGGLIAASTFLGFVFSRTTSLLGFRESNWELLGILTLALDAAFLVLFAHRERSALARIAVVVLQTAPASPARARASTAPAFRAVCGAGPIRCMSLIRTDIHAVPGTNARHDGHGPAELRSAYKLAAASASRGAAQT